MNSNDQKMSQSDEMKDYEVGYGKPPKQHQFKPGQSGNPKGGKKPTKTIDDLVFDEASKLVTVKMGSEAVKINKRDALVKAIFAKALKGDLKAAQFIISLLGQADAKLLATEAQKLTQAEIEILKEVFGKVSDGGE